jgi:hypothetical protein
LLTFAFGESPESLRHFAVEKPSARSQIEHAGKELLRACRSCEFQPDRSLVWFDCDVEVQKPATLPFYVNNAGDRGQEIVGSREAHAVAIRQLESFVGSTYKSTEQVLTTRFDRSGTNVQPRH